MEDDLSRSRDGDDHQGEGRGLEERLDAGQLLPQVQGDRGGRGQKITGDRLPIPATKAADGRTSLSPGARPWRAYWFGFDALERDAEPAVTALGSGVRTRRCARVDPTRRPGPRGIRTLRRGGWWRRGRGG